jgi:hypothetical protein
VPCAIEGGVPNAASARQDAGQPQQCCGGSVATASAWSLGPQVCPAGVAGGSTASTESQPGGNTGEAEEPPGPPAALCAKSVAELGEPVVRRLATAVEELIAILDADRGASPSTQKDEARALLERVVQLLGSVEDTHAVGQGLAEGSGGRLEVACPARGGQP